MSFTLGRNSNFAFAPNNKEIRRRHLGWSDFIDAEINMRQGIISIIIKQTRPGSDGREQCIPLKGTKCFNVLWTKVTNAALNEKDNEPELLAVTGENCDETVFLTELAKIYINSQSTVSNMEHWLSLL